MRLQRLCRFCFLNVFVALVQKNLAWGRLRLSIQYRRCCCLWCGQSLCNCTCRGARMVVSSFRDIFIFFAYCLWCFVCVKCFIWLFSSCSIVVKRSGPAERPTSFRPHRRAIHTRGIPSGRHIRALCIRLR